VGHLPAVQVASLHDWGFSLNQESRNPETAGPEQSFKYVDLSAVSFGTFHDVKVLRGMDAPSRARRVMRRGNIIFATVRPYLQGHAVVPPELDGEICSTGFSVIQCPADFDPKFVFYMLVAPQVIDRSEELMRGSHYPALNEEHVKLLRIPKPPIDEQRRVVQLLDRLVDSVANSEKTVRRSARQIESAFTELIPSFLSIAYSSARPKPPDTPPES